MTTNKTTTSASSDDFSLHDMAITALKGVIACEKLLTLERNRREMLDYLYRHLYSKHYELVDAIKELFARVHDLEVIAKEVK